MPSERAKRAGARNRAKYAEEQRAREAEQLAIPRSIEADISLSGTGERIVRIHYTPSFSPAHIWDIRVRCERFTSETYAVFRNDVLQSGQIAPGYEFVECEQSAIEELVQKIEASQLPLKRQELDYMHADGTTLGLTLELSFLQKVYISWHVDPPPALQAVHAHLLKLIPTLLPEHEEFKF